MSRGNGRHAKVTSRNKGRHAKPAPPNPAVTVIGTAARAVPATLAIGAAGSALALSGTASAATTTGSATIGGAAQVATASPAQTTSFAVGVRHRGSRSSYTVISGDTLSHISARFCGTSRDFRSLASASKISNPDRIMVGQKIKLDCHAPVTALAAAPVQQAPAPVQQAPAAVTSATVGTAGMGAFEACVIAAESGGNPEAVNPSSGAGGLFQFLPSTWAALGYAGSYPGGAQTAPASVQEAAFAKAYAESGTAPWAPYDGC